MERDVAWKKYDEDDLEALEHLAAEYIDFISDNKTERECAAAAIALAEEHGYVSLDDAVREGRALKTGDKVWAQAHGKALILVQLGEEPLAEGLNILGAHIDSPRLDLKQNPLYESNGFALLDTHYYGGIKNYQWVTLPLAMHGVIAKKDGTVVDVQVGDDPDDPVFCVTDLLIHLAGKQMAKKANEVVEGEDLDILIGNRPAVSAAQDADAGESDTKDAEKEPVKAFALKLLAEKYGIDEEDFLSAEIEIVPAGRARDLGFDRSMVIGYGQDDRVCAYTSLVAQLAVEQPAKTAVCVLVDKEEIGSVGATGMASQFFENTIAEVMELAGEGGPLPLRRALASEQHAVVRRVRRLRPRLRERLRGEELRVPRARPRVQQVHGQPRQERLQRRERRVRRAHPSRHGRRGRVVPDRRAGQSGRGRRRDIAHPRQIRHGRHRLGRAGAVDALPVGSHQQSRHLRGVQGLRSVPEERVGAEIARGGTRQGVPPLVASARCGVLTSASVRCGWRSRRLLPG